MKFINEFTFEKRVKEASIVISKHPDRLPIICEKLESSNINSLDKKKYLVPDDFTLGQFVAILRTKLKLSPEKAIFIFAGSFIPSFNSTISSIYYKYKNIDGFLYLTYADENVFG
jgi:GABA(A) receptor-associated protein